MFYYRAKSIIRDKKEIKRSNDVYFLFLLLWYVCFTNVQNMYKTWKYTSIIIYEPYFYKLSRNIAKYN